MFRVSQVSHKIESLVGGLELKSLCNALIYRPREPVLVAGNMSVSELGGIFPTAWDLTQATR